jgi:hypothetical protein
MYADSMFPNHQFEEEPASSPNRAAGLRVRAFTPSDVSGGVAREQKMLKGRLPRVIYHRVYSVYEDKHSACSRTTNSRTSLLPRQIAPLRSGNSLVPCLILFGLTNSFFFGQPIRGQEPRCWYTGVPRS